MTELKCPFCGQTIACADTQVADEYSTWLCPRCIAERKWYAFGNKTLWQELIRTLKAFEKAVDGLLAVWRATDHTTEQGSIAYNVLRDLNIKPLDRIKALEQIGENK